MKSRASELLETRPIDHVVIARWWSIAMCALGRRSGIITFSSIGNSFSALSAIMMQFSDDLTARVYCSSCDCTSTRFEISFIGAPNIKWLCSLLPSSSMALSALSALGAVVW